MIGEIPKGSSVSGYQPSADICEFTKFVKQDFFEGNEILNRPWLELNDRSVIEDENRGQMMFNAFVDTDVEDPAEAWKWRGTRSTARNKGIAMHANLTANYLLPLFMAQNENDEEDRDFSQVMRDIIEWMAAPSNSNYQSSFLQIVFAMETNPVTFLGAEFCEITQTIRERQQDGSYTTKEILDEVLSGFKVPIYSASQILITNAYERNIQKQRRIIKRRFAEYQELEAKFGDHPNWEYVQPGIRSIYSEDDGLFYDIKDDNSLSMSIVSEEIALSRRNDSEVPFVNGVYLGDMDNIENNPIKHRDNRGAPKYNVVPFGFHRIGEHFFYYKSMMNAMGWDNMLYDALSEIVMNRAMLETEMPVAISGSDQIDSDIIFPNAVVAFQDKDTRITPLIPSSNMAGAFSALRETENSMSDASLNDTMAGQLPQASQKAYSVAQAQANSKKLIGGIGKSLAESVIQMGDLMKDIALNNITSPQVEELVGGNLRLKYHTFILPNKTSGGKAVSRTIKFDSSFMNKDDVPEVRKEEEMSILEEVGYPDHKNSLYRVNPELFAKFKYLTKVDIEEMFPKNQEYWQPVLLSLKQALSQDPYIDQEALDRKLMYAYFQSDGEDLIKKNPQLPTDTQNPTQSPMAQMVQNKALDSASVGAAVQ